MTQEVKNLEREFASKVEDSLMILTGIQRALRATVAAMERENEGEYMAIHYLSNQMHSQLRLMEKALFPEANGAIVDPENRSWGGSTSKTSCTNGVVETVC